jgi:hypothetical protein
MSNICRINNKHKFKNESEKLAHEKKCPDLPKSKYKICIYNPKHLLLKEKYEIHIKKFCNNRPKEEEIVIQNKNNNTYNNNNNKDEGIESNKQKSGWGTTEEEEIIDNKEKKNEMKNIQENYVFDEEDKIFIEAYAN